MDDTPRREVAALRARLEKTQDAARVQAVAKRHDKGFLTARENLAALVDPGSFVEYGQLTVAAQRRRRDYEELQTATAADGVITGTANIDGQRCAVVINDYSVLAGTQGYFHHKKLDRMFELAEREGLPVVMYTEGGGGRPGDTDTMGSAGLKVPSFLAWARLSGKVPRIAVNNGYCFAGNAALFGCADITIATRTSWIGMAGPALIEGGGLGVYPPKTIGPIEVQQKNGVVDIVVEDEAEAARVARRVLGYFTMPRHDWRCTDQTALDSVIPEDRRWGYPVRKIIEILADTDSFTELRRIYGRSVITGLIRIEGRPLGLIASDCQQLGGAIDSEAAEKAARFLQLCDAFALPVLSLCDTPGFMVGPKNEEQAAVRRMSSLFVTGASISVPLIAIVLRKGYGLGVMALTGGSLAAPLFTAAWPTGEFGAMGLEGAVRLGYRKELEAVADDAERAALFDKLVAEAYARGKATEAAAMMEVDAVIEPAQTRAVILQSLERAAPVDPPAGRRRNFIDTR